MSHESLYSDDIKRHGTNLTPDRRAVNECLGLIDSGVIGGKKTRKTLDNHAVRVSAATRLLEMIQHYHYPSLGMSLGS